MADEDLDTRRETSRSAWDNWSRFAVPVFVCAILSDRAAACLQADPRPDQMCPLYAGDISIARNRTDHDNADRPGGFEFVTLVCHVQTGFRGAVTMASHLCRFSVGYSHGGQCADYGDDAQQ